MRLLYRSLDLIELLIPTVLLYVVFRISHLGRLEHLLAEAAARMMARADKSGDRIVRHLFQQLILLLLVVVVVVMDLVLLLQDADRLESSLAVQRATVLRWETFMPERIT